MQGLDQEIQLATSSTKTPAALYVPQQPTWRGLLPRSICYAALL